MATQFFTNWAGKLKKGDIIDSTTNKIKTSLLDLTGITGYDATKTQVLKNVSGTLTWVDE